MNEKQVREIDLRQTAYGYAQELALAQLNIVGLSAGTNTKPEPAGIVAAAKVIHDYITKGK